MFLIIENSCPKKHLTSMFISRDKCNVSVDITDYPLIGKQENKINLAIQIYENSTYKIVHYSLLYTIQYCAVLCSTIVYCICLFMWEIRAENFENIVFL